MEAVLALAHIAAAVPAAPAGLPEPSPAAPRAPAGDMSEDTPAAHAAVDRAALEAAPACSFSSCCCTDTGHRLSRYARPGRASTPPADCNILPCTPAAVGDAAEPPAAVSPRLLPDAAAAAAAAAPPAESPPRLLSAPTAPGTPDEEPAPPAPALPAAPSGAPAVAASVDPAAAVARPAALPDRAADPASFAS